MDCESMKQTQFNILNILNTYMYKTATLSSTNNAEMTERRHTRRLIIWVGNVLYQIILQVQIK